MGSGLTRGEASEPEELESMSSGLGFSMLAKGMAKNVGEMQTSESVTDYVKRAIATTTPVVNSFIQWKAGAQKRVTKFLKEQPAKDDDDSLPLSSFTAGPSVLVSSSSMGIYDSAGRELIWNEAADDFVPVPVETAFDAAVWDTIDKSRKAPVSELQEVITGMHHSSADFNGDEQ